MSKKKLNKYNLVYKEKWSTAAQVVAASKDEALEEAEALRVHNLLKSKGGGDWTVVARLNATVEEEVGDTQLEEHIAKYGSIGEQVQNLDRAIAVLQRIRGDLIEGRAGGA